jgi:cyclase
LKGNLSTMINLTPSSAGTRRDFLKSSSLFLGAAAVSTSFPGALFAQDDSARLDQMRKQLLGTIQVSKVSGNVSMLSGAGGNIGILTGTEGKFVVDSGVLPATPAVLQALGQLDALPLKYLINTHWHFDHTDGNAQFHNAGAAVVATAKTRDRLSTPQFSDILQLHAPASPAAALPTRTLTGNFTFYHDNEEVVLQALPPAHTDTDLFVHFTNADVVHCGDVFFNGAYPLIDYSSGGSVNGYIDGMSKILLVAKDSTKIIPGHGPLGSKADCIAAHDMLATVRDRVAAAKKSGKSLDETLASKPTADLDAKWGKGFLPPDLFVTVVYKSLS